MTKKHIPVRHRAKELHEWQLGDHAQHGDIVVADIEKAYRRGFTQGMSMVRQYVERFDLTIDDLKEWELTLMKWRRASFEWIKGQPVVANYPPDPKVK